MIQREYLDSNNGSPDHFKSTQTGFSTANRLSSSVYTNLFSSLHFVQRSWRIEPKQVKLQGLIGQGI